MKIKSLTLSVFILSIIIIVSCSKEKDLPKVDHKELDLSAESYTYINVSSEMGKLGRVLFYDKSLSVNNGVSCGSCHKQALAFSDDKQFSTGFENKETSRNTPPIQNLNAAGGIIDILPASTGQALFWDGRERSLKQMVMAPIVNHVEMGMRSQEDIIEKISEKAYYRQLFVQAYGDDIINFDRVAEALSGFTGSIISQSSQFDLSLFDNNSQFSDLQIEGQNLFFGKYNCGSCHNLFSNTGYSEPSGEELLNIGLDEEYADNGMGALTGNASDNGRFKIPNLRNIELTGPYMHDGRFATLSDVIDHYSTGVKNHPNLDSRLKDQNDNPVVFNITENEKAALIAFMHTLTDRQLISDPKFSDPFN